MEGRKFRNSLFIFWLILTAVSVIWIMFTFYNYIDLMFTESAFLFVFIISWIGLIIASISIYEIFINDKDILNKKQKTQDTVKEVYRYQQVLDPPDAEMNN